jgi:hypothetical protein
MPDFFHIMPDNFHYMLDDFHFMPEPRAKVAKSCLQFHNSTHLIDASK